jgi:hypothetical protein
VHAPDDYRRLVEWFPLVELEILRREWIGKEDVDGTTLPVINATLRAG